MSSDDRQEHFSLRGFYWDSLVSGLVFQMLDSSSVVMVSITIRPNSARALCRQFSANIVQLVLCLGVFPLIVSV
jgi:hypothetical protein